MALLTDDEDLRTVYMRTEHGGNGDYYITLTEYPKPESTSGAKAFRQINYRMAMSGGNARNYPEVREAFIALFRAMQKAGLNDYPSTKPQTDEK